MYLGLSANIVIFAHDMWRMFFGCHLVASIVPYLFYQLMNSGVFGEKVFEFRFRSLGIFFPVHSLTLCLICKVQTTCPHSSY